MKLTEVFTKQDQAQTLLEEEIEMEQPLTLIQRRNFMQLPLEERRRLMAQQADKLSEHYDQDQEWRDLGGGDMKLRDVIEAHKYSKADGRDYEKERKYNDTPKARKYRARLNKYNRDKGKNNLRTYSKNGDKGTYGNGDGRDASHSGGSIAGFESSSKNKGRKEKSRLKKK